MLIHKLSPPERLCMRVEAYVCPHPRGQTELPLLETFSQGALDEDILQMPC